MKAACLFHQLLTLPLLLFSSPVLWGGPAHAQTRSAGLEGLIKAAAVEGQLAVQSAAPDNPKTWAAWEKAIRARYGISVTLQHTIGPQMPQMAARLIEEFKAGKPASSDVYIGTEATMVEVSRAGAMQVVNWAELSPEIPRDAIAPDQSAVAFATLARAVAYNTRLVPKDQVPRTLDDVLHPRFKGKVASTPVAVGFVPAALVAGEERITKFLTSLARGGNLAGLIPCGQEERIIAGEFALFVFSCSSRDGEVAKRKGGPLDQTLLEDAPTIGYWYMGVPKNSRHPNLARLFTLFVETGEAQRIMWEHDAIDLHLIKGTNMAREVERWRARGIEPKVFGVQEMLAMGKTFGDLRVKFQKILRGD